MTPNLGQGACQAPENAVTLAAELSAEPAAPAERAPLTGPALSAALAHYDDERRPRSQAIAAAARQAGRMGQQLDHPFAVGMRNMVLRMAPSRLSVRVILRHATWTPPQLRPGVNRSFS